MTIPKPATISRRDVLAGACALAFAVNGTALPAFASEPTAKQALLSLLSDQSKAAVIGSAWVQQNHQNPKPDSVMNDLAISLHQQGWAGNLDVNDLRTKFAGAVQADYRNGNVVTIQGWQIARTQAELCALAYFSTAGLI
jgi:hypothetical protein